MTKLAGGSRVSCLDSGGRIGGEMRNPWLKKNPFMSAWLSGANRVLGSARGHMTATAKRQISAVQADVTRDLIDFWTGRAKPPSMKRKKRR